MGPTGLRFVVTNLEGDPQAVHDDLNRRRGEAGKASRRRRWRSFATRTSCHVMRSNPLRTQFAALGYVIVERFARWP
jgi:hypothetical protein